MSKALAVVECAVSVLNAMKAVKEAHYKSIIASIGW